MMWAAFLAGLAGSFHCLGMCGPIALGLPGKDGPRFRFFAGRLLYNFGRIATYSVLGGFAALLGLGAFLFHAQQWVSVSLGIILLLWALKELGWLPGPASYPGQKVALAIRGVFSKFFVRGTPGALFVVGLLNGLLPCGFVYLGLFTAVMAGGPFQGMLSMALFGLGTLPLMLILSLTGAWAGQAFRKKLTKAMPFVLAAFAILFVVRGLGLGIPYISPSFQEGKAKTEDVADCCKIRMEENKGK